jgi:DNA topoisomerase-1
MKKFSRYPKKNFPKKEISCNIPKDACYLIIVESPSKCKKIEDFLGSNYYCIASKGHIREIKGLKSIDTKNTFQTDYTIIEEKKDHVECMRKIIIQFPKENVILATDDDREGEGIAWHICQTFDLDVLTTKRILFREITQKAITTAVLHPTIINMNIVYAQQARQILDMIVGYKISPILWKYLYSNKDNALSAGRCQTPALRLIYEKELEESKKEVKYNYKTVGSFFSNNILFELNKEFEKEEEIHDFLEKSKDFKYNLSISEKKNKEKQSPKPFNTSNLLQIASNVLKMSPKETTSLCQQLYQDGHITYIRTDSMKYSSTFIHEVTTYITDKCHLTPNYIGNTDIIENKDANNPHEAIRVTHIEVETINTEN